MEKEFKKEKPVKAGSAEADERQITAYIAKFALPLIAGSILQQLYNAVDAVIVGRFLGEASFAAVSVAAPVMSLLIFFIYGLGIGMNVLFARKYGSGDERAFRTTTGTALTAGCLFAAALSAVCIVNAPWILRFCNCPEEIFRDALIYLRIVESGLIFTFLYNFYSAAFLAIGDSRTPFLSLLVSAGINIGLDLVFVAALRLGTGGAAAATVIAQACSMLFCTLYVRAKRPMLRLGIRDLGIDRGEIKEILTYSGISAIQQTVLYGGRLMVQGAVNTLSIGTIAGYGAACRIESFVLAPMEGTASASSSYIARSLGEGRKDHVKAGYHAGLRICACITVITGILIYLFAPRIIPLFLTNISEDAKCGGVTYLRHMAFFYQLIILTQMFQALFRGVGKLKTTFINTLLQIFFRVVVSWTFIGRMGVAAVAWACAAGWAAMIIYGSAEVILFFRKEGI